jgi:hypothetical protein
MTLGNAAAASVRLIAWCKDCQHQVEPDPAEMAARYADRIWQSSWLGALKYKTYLSLSLAN